MRCKICGNKDIKIIYNGKIRNGGLGQYTKEDIPVYQCEACKVIWHDNVLYGIKEYYESTEYRESLEGGSEEEQFYELHDKDTLAKFQYTSTSIFRNKIVADIGCGGGAFLDFISGVAASIVAVEPSKTYREIMDRKGYHTYPYTEHALSDYRGQIDVATSFDVIEHVKEPEKFLKDIFELLSAGGRAVIGTPTDAPVMRQLLGETYEKKLLFSTQHLWVFSGTSMNMMAKRCGYSDIKVKYFQRYGIDNALGWIRDREPNSEITVNGFTQIFNDIWRNLLVEKGLADYLILYLQK